MFRFGVEGLEFYSPTWDSKVKVFSATASGFRVGGSGLRSGITINIV